MTPTRPPDGPGTGVRGGAAPDVSLVAGDGSGLSLVAVPDRAPAASAAASPAAAAAPGGPVRRFELLAWATQQFLPEPDPGTVVERLLDGVCLALDLELCWYFRVPPGGPGTLRLEASRGLTAERRAASRDVRHGEHLCAVVAADRAPLVVDDLAGAPYREAADLVAAGVRCFAGWPLLVRGRLLGAVAFAARRRIDEADRDLLEALVAQLSLYLALTGRRRDGAGRDERTRLFVEQAPVAMAMFDREMRYVSLSRRWLAELGLEGQDLVGRSHYEVFPEITDDWRQVHRRALAGEVLRREEDRFERPDGSVQWLRWEVRPWWDASGEVAGIIIFSEDITARKQVEEDLRAREAEGREIALSLQRALLPAHLLRHPMVHVGAQYSAGNGALEVGGDWYDAFALDDGRVALTVGDVVGSGLEAAAAMGQVRTALAALAPRCTPAELFVQLDTFIARSGVTEFTTVCYAVYDPATGRLDFASAGHPPMLAVSPSGDVRLLRSGQSPPLVGWPVWERREASVVLEPGTLLLLYSDGLVERRGEDLEVGLARLGAAAVSLVGMPVDEACTAVLREVRGGRGARDDTVVVAARVVRASATRLHLVVPATPDQVPLVGGSVRAWLGREGGDETDAGAQLLLAVGRACRDAVGGGAARGRCVEVAIDRRADGALDLHVRGRSGARSGDWSSATFRQGRPVCVNGPQTWDVRSMQ